MSLIRAIDERDFPEAQFSARQIADQAWAENQSRIGNAAMTLEISLRAADQDPLQRYEDDLAFLIAEVDVKLRPLRKPSP